VDDIASAATYQSKDLLVIGAYRDLSSVPEIAGELPLQLTDGGWVLSMRARLSRWLNGVLHLPGPDSELSFEDGEIAPAGVIESIRSPYHSDRSLVVIMARDNAALAAMRDGLLAEMPHDGIRGTTSLWQGGKFSSYDLATPAYHIGEVSFLKRLELTLPEYPFELAAALLVFCSFIAAWMQASLGALIRRRLMGAPQLGEPLPRGGAL
jgi:hypothetical protein